MVVHNSIFLREFLNALQSHFNSEEEFVRNFIKHPRLCFSACFRQSYEDTLGLLNPAHNLLHVLKEVRTLLLLICWTSISHYDVIHIAKTQVSLQHYQIMCINLSMLLLASLF